MKGFSLMEVLVALVILATTMVALYSTTQSATWATHALEQKTAAHWLTLSLQAEQENQMLTDSSGNTQQLGFSFHWQTNHENDIHVAIHKK